MLRWLKNSQLRLFFSGSLFTGAFIWMAVTSYGVTEEEIKVYLIMALILVGVLIGAGLIFSLFFRLVRLRNKSRNKDWLGTLEKEVAEESGKTDP